MQRVFLWLGAMVLGACRCDSDTPTAEGAAEPQTAEAARAGEERLNVLWVVLDTVRADRTGVGGHVHPTTPHLDALAREGVTFDRVVSPGMWTLPSHASLFTGLPVSAHGVHAHHKWLDSRFVTVAEVMREAGYATWLLSANPFLQSHTNLVQGFDTTLYPWRPPLRRAARRHTKSKIHPDDASNSLAPKWEPGRYDSGRSLDQAKDLGPVAGRALGRWIGDQAGPWFAFVNLMEAHTPRVPSQASRDAVTPDRASLDAQLSLDQSDGHQLAYTVGLHAYDAEDLRRIEEVYDASVRDADAALGGLLAAVKDHGAWDRTVVVVTSDHGEHLGEHGLLGHKFSVYEPLVGVPLVVRSPERSDGERTEEAVVSTMDIMPTLLSSLALPIPDGVQGRSLWERGEVDEPLFSEMLSATPRALERLGKIHPTLDWSPWLRTWTSVREGDWKCLRRSDGHEELYRLDRDPAEQRNLQPAMPDKASSLCGRIDRWRESFSAYDPSDKGESDPAEVTLPDETRRRLEALGYVDP